MIVLVEGESDRVALETLARRLGGEGRIVPIGGAQAVGRYLERFAGEEVAGLCDAKEAPGFLRAFERAGRPPRVCVCDPDLEGELIRALGAERVEEVIAAQGELGRFRTMQKQAEWRGRPPEEQLRRWLGSGARRKARYAELLVDALELGRIPEPLRTCVRIMLGPSQMDL